MNSSLLISIRCANQSFKDVNVEIETNWTVSLLKSYLQENYPSKPDAKKQRLIYAGQLMKDSQLLSTYFDRKGVDKIDHLPVVHLVCTPSSDQFRSPGGATVGSGLRQRRPPAPAATVQPAVVNNAQPSPSNVAQHPFVSIATDANVAQQTPGAFYYGGGTSDAVATDPNWQQAQQMYNAYMMQYVQYLQNLYGVTYWPWTVGAGLATMVTPLAPSSGGSPLDGQLNATPPVPAAANAAQQQQPRAEPAMNAAQGGVDDDDEAHNRDWLDWLYMACRAGLLFTILYFYSSMERFSFVMFCCVLIYGFQAGWFGRRAGGDHNNGGRQQQQRNNNNVPANQAPPAVAGEPPANEIPPSDRSAEENPPAAVAVEQPQTAWFVFWSTCWTFFSSFFASLVPQRPPPMNLN